MRKRIDFKLVKIIAILYGLVAAISFFKAIYFILKKNTHRKESFSWIQTFFQSAFIDWLIIVPFMVIIAMITKKMFDKEMSTKLIIVFHLFISLTIGRLILFVNGVIFYALNQINIESYNYYLSLDTTIRYLDTTFLTYLMLTAVIYIYYYIERIKIVEKQKSILTNQLNNTKLKVLKAQLQPHFLFNTLNSISTLIEIDSKQAQNTIIDLSDLLREILNLKENTLIPLEEELKIVKKYIDILKIRFSDHLSINTNINPRILDALVPNMLIQPILENSIKHGFTKTNLTINILIYKKEENLFIKIENNGKLLKGTQKEILNKGVGLKNTIDRLNVLFLDNYQFKIYNENDKGVTVEIRIPFKIKSYQLVI